ncbi:uncharacterized protein LOC122529953 [Frieseomelitta varia]|uniref:uncharacterized protein LOC122529953 n=1 Tax=Frieseomelitta varia TaxID=561572 RepID=UPI001CB6A47F|nr:uncharacterized protein LOC122529953 [Frieseomelitta varia]
MNDDGAIGASPVCVCNAAAPGHPRPRRHRSPATSSSTFGHGKINPIFKRRTQFGEDANRGPGRRCISGWTSSPSGLLHPCGLRSNGTKGFVSHLPASNNEDTLLSHIVMADIDEQRSFVSRRRI